MKKCYYQSSLGALEICASEEYIISIRFIAKENMKANDHSVLLSEAITQLDEYFSGKRYKFDLPLKQTGTVFQQKAWDYLQTIPYGQTVSYKTEAIGIGNPNAYRAVGSANGKNNIVIVVPCHRVINENKSLGGYAYGLNIKEELLNIEKRYLKND